MATNTAHLFGILTCSRCENYLNIPPIISLKDGSTICGRCYDPAKYENNSTNDKLFRNIPLETVIQLVPFPCKYRDNGCQLKNVSKNYLKHEAICSYRPFVCPIEICTWSGLMINLKDHFEIDHKDNFLTTSIITINTNVDCIDHYIVHNENLTILYQSKYDATKNLYFCDSVSLVNEHHNGRTYHMELEFNNYNNNPTSIISFKKPTSDNVESIDESKALQINVQTLKSLINADQLEANVKIVCVNDENYKNIDYNLLNELKCPVCLNLFIPRVFLCSNGHSICEACKNQLIENTCPICKVPYECTLYNITLEKLIRTMIYPCKNHISGCSFVAPSTQIGEHETKCEYSTVV